MAIAKDCRNLGQTTGSACKEIAVRTCSIGSLILQQFSFSTTLVARGAVTTAVALKLSAARTSMSAILLLACLACPHGFVLRMSQTISSSWIAFVYASRICRKTASVSMMSRLDKPLPAVLQMRGQ
ncbi:hypothetical protein KCU73_g126, partial [Aureobasidium melanogenum]